MSVKKIEIKPNWTAVDGKGHRAENLNPDTLMEMAKGTRIKEIPIICSAPEEVRGEVQDIADSLNRVLKESDKGFILILDPNFVKAPEKVPEGEPSNGEGKALRSPKTRFIVLDRGLVYPDGESAYKALLQIEPLNVKSKIKGDKLKGSFTSRGTVLGHVNSLIRDVKAHGLEAMQPRLKAYDEFVTKSPAYVKFNGLYNQGVQPEDVVDPATNRVNHTYFKYWALRRMAAEDLKKAGVKASKAKEPVKTPTPTM